MSDFKVSRVGGVTEAGDDVVLQDVFSHILAKRGHLLNIHKVVALSPKILHAQAAYALAIREYSSIPRDLQEILILRIAQVNDSAYEQTVHQPIAIDLGLPRDKVLEIASWRNSALFSEKEQAALAFVEQAAASGQVDDEVFGAASELFSAKEMVEIAVFVGWYTGNTKFTRSLQVAGEAESAHC